MFIFPLVHSARNLVKKDLFSKLFSLRVLLDVLQSLLHVQTLAVLSCYSSAEKPDPFAKIEVEGSGQCHCTEPVRDVLDPKWNQHYDL